MYPLQTRSRRTRRAMMLGAATATAALVLAGCSSGGDGGDDGNGGDGDGESKGELKISTILPQTGNLSFLGPPEFAGVDLAAADLEAAGYEYEVTISHHDSGDTTTDIATQSADAVIQEGASVVIGAASSGVSFTFIDKMIDANIVMISPANTAPDFSDYDDNDVYWRTAPSDVLQGRVLGNLMTSDGAANVAFLVVNDPYGTGLADNARLAVESAGGTVVAEELFNPAETNFATYASAIMAQDPDAIALITFDEAALAVPALIDAGASGDQMYFVDGNLSNGFDFPEGTLEGAQGTQPGVIAEGDFRDRLLEVDSSLQDFNYAAESYDAVILSALAAAQGGGTDADTIKANLMDVSTGGTKCTEVKECLDLIAAGEDIDYDGVSGPIEFNEQGDPTSAYIGIYQYGADNTYEFVRAEEGSI